MRRPRVERTRPGAGTVMVQTPLASLLETSIGLDRFLVMVRSGMLDAAARDDSFDWSDDPGAVLEARRHLVPAATPTIRGVLSWRRAPGKWSLDSTHCLLSPGVRFWSSVSGGAAQIGFEGVVLPDTVMATIAGRRLVDVVDHPHLRDPDILVVSGTCYPPHPARPPLVTATAGTTELKLTVPTIDRPDPARMTWEDIR